jgi:hypothetical protein
MPLLRFDVISGRTEEELSNLLNAAHEAVLAAFGVPERDRYQVVQEHQASRLRVEDTGLGIARSDKIVLLQRTSRRRRTVAQSKRFTGFYAIAFFTSAASAPLTSSFLLSKTATATGRSEMLRRSS